MVSNFEHVGDFMEAFGQAVRSEPVFPDPAEVDLRVKLIEEEVQELKDAIVAHDIVAIADALTDILYVTYGAGHSFGLDLDACFEEVHTSNMSKLGPDGYPIYNEIGKVMKGPDYCAPDLDTVLNITYTH